VLIIVEWFYKGVKLKSLGMAGEVIDALMDFLIVLITGIK
jgi:hypothetical protein